MKLTATMLIAACSVVSLSAHIIVSPLQSKLGATQRYEFRAHNEASVAATSIDLDIPDGVDVIEMTKPASGSYTTTTVGKRVTRVTWQIDVPPNK